MLKHLLSQRELNINGRNRIRYDLLGWIRDLCISPIFGLKMIKAEGLVHVHRLGIYSAESLNQHEHQATSYH